MRSPSWCSTARGLGRPRENLSIEDGSNGCFKATFKWMLQSDVQIHRQNFIPGTQPLKSSVCGHQSGCLDTNRNVCGHQQECVWTSIWMSVEINVDVCGHQSGCLDTNRNVCGHQYGCLWRSMWMSVDTNMDVRTPADVCGHQYGCLWTPTRMSVEINVDVCGH